MIFEEKDIIDQNDEPLIYTVSDLADVVAEAIAKEREACAKAAENEWNFDSTECGIDVANDIAAAIRARGEITA